MSVSYSIRGTPQQNNLPVPNEAALAYDFVGNTLWGSSPDTGEWIALGGGASGGPVISARLQQTNATVPTSVTASASNTAMYAISISLESTGTAASGHLVVATLTWTSPLNTHTITLTLPLDSEQVVMETYPILALANTTVSFTTSYAGGATDDPYTVSARLVQMP
jgi:hypothetical protein